MNILITGATGNIGREVIKHFDYASNNTVVAAVQDPEKCAFDEPVKLIAFDFHDLDSVRAAMHKIDVIFLLRPPHIADVEGIYKPIVEVFKSVGIKHVVFLSVQGVENTPIIPHYKIEKLLRESEIPYTFIRPSYFMQNLTTTLRKDVERGEISLPSGSAKFNWVDAADIGRAIAVVLKTPSKHRKRAYVITGSEQLDFKEVADMISRVSGRPMQFRSSSLPSFFFRKRRDGERIPMIFVSMMLHFLPRFAKTPPLSDDFKALTGREPGTLEQFIKREMMVS